MQNIEIIEKIIDSKTEITTALSSGASCGLLVLLRLYDFKGDLFGQLEPLEHLLQELKEEQVYYDLLMINELVVINKDNFKKNDIEEFICIFMDRVISNFNFIDEITAIEKIQFRISKIKTNKNNFFFDVFCLRLSLICFDTTSSYRLHLRENLKINLRMIKKFPLNFFKVFKAAATFKKLMRIITAVESIGSNQTVTSEKHFTVYLMRETAIDVVNSNPVVAGVSRYLYSLVNPYTSDMDELRRLSTIDQKLLDSGKKNHMRFNAVIFIISLFCLGPILFDSYHEWFMSSEGQRGESLTISAVKNPALTSKLVIGDKILRINDIINPSYSEFRQEIANSQSELKITKSRDGNFETISVFSILDTGGTKKLGVSFFQISDGQKIITILLTIWLLYLLFELGKYMFRFIDVLSLTISYSLNLLMIISYVVFYELILRILGLNFHTVLISIGFIFGAKYIYEERWILKGWVSEIKDSFQGSK